MEQVRFVVVCYWSLENVEFPGGSDDGVRPSSNNDSVTNSYLSSPLLDDNTKRLDTRFSFVRSVSDEMLDLTSLSPNNNGSRTNRTLIRRDTNDISIVPTTYSISKERKKKNKLLIKTPNFDEIVTVPEDNDRGIEVNFG